MKLEGSCHCGAVHFSVESHTPYPFMRCYCSICRKTAGGGGYAINIMGDADSLKVRGRKDVSGYRARLTSPGSNRRTRSPAERHFCARCASALWVFDPRWPEWIYPFASAIDTPLPKPARGRRTDAELRRAVGRCPGWAGARAFSGVSGGIDCRLAPQARTHRRVSAVGTFAAVGEAIDPDEAAVRNAGFRRTANFDRSGSGLPDERRHRGLKITAAGAIVRTIAGKPGSRR